MSALFNFDSFFRVFLLLLCISKYTEDLMPSMVNKNGGFSSFLYKLSVLAARGSFYVSMCCFFYWIKKNNIYFLLLNL